ncbi:unnamed protein product [Orchesella dallaii]|uniref:Uncharacterized protein n=1 Tax=Orchesella dallaii TaxID=48710 RepID=A0ABP1R091_9HEXA
MYHPPHIHYILLLFIATGGFVKGEDIHQIELLSDRDFSGKRTLLNLTYCSNVANSAINTTSSIKTYGRCAQLYDQLNCTGNAIQIPARGPSSHNLEKWGFNDKVQSVGFCRDPCTPEADNPFSNSTESDLNHSVAVTLYEKAYRKGKAYTFKISGCIIIKDLKHRMRETFQSVRIPEEGCVLLHMGVSDDDATGCVVENQNKVLEFRAETPSLENLQGWGYNSREFVKAVSPCYCQSHMNNTLPENQDNSTEIEEYIKFYDALNFQGNSIKIPLTFTGCQNFSNTAADQNWEGLAKSIRISNGSCVQVYREEDCTDPVSLDLTTSVANLTEFNLNEAIRSFSRCDCDKSIPEEPVPAESTTRGYVQNPDADEESKGSTSLTFYLVPLVGVSLIVSLILIGVLIRMKRQTRNIMKTKFQPEKLSDKEIHEFTHGLGLELGDVDVAERKRSIENEYENGNADRPESLKFSSDLLAQNQPYNFELELPKSVLEFGK